jgi:peptidoglycan/LPS O-acetylase OafA/YrhL
MRRIAEIETLRAVAVLMVLAEHMPFDLFYWRTAWYDFSIAYFRGSAGVDLFFAISGFVIARSLLPGLAQARHAGRTGRYLAGFWLRRIFRLWPAAWLWLAVPLWLTVAFNRSGAFHTIIGNIHAAAAAVLNVANLYLAHTIMRRPDTAFMHYWSLSEEEQFYLLLPLLALVLRRWLVWLLVALAFYQVVMPPTFLAALTRPSCLAVGVLLAIAEARPFYARLAPALLGRGRWAGPVAGVVLIAALGFQQAGIAELHEGRGWAWGLQPPLAGLLVFIASFDRGYLLAPGPLRQVMSWLGARSYSLYLCHIPAYAVVQEAQFRIWGHEYQVPAGQGFLMMAAALPLALLAAEATYRLVEVPARTTGKAIAARLWTRPTLAAAPRYE